MMPNLIDGIIDIAALLHDVLDKKYASVEEYSNPFAFFLPFFESITSKCPSLDLIKDAWDQSSSTTVLYFVIVFLVISNVWTLTMMGRREEAGRRKEVKRSEEREKWVQGIVTALWDELNTNKVAAGGLPVTRSSSGDVKEEIAELSMVLDRVEERIQSIRKSLQDLD